METKVLRPYFVVIGLMLLTSLTLAFTVDVRITDEAGVKLALPERVGSWTGEDLFFCQNPVCQKEFRRHELKDTTICPACGEKLGPMTVGEKELLPPDTVIFKKEYTNPNGKHLFVSIVLSGKERASIHRPEVCLVGQGSEIEKNTVVDVPMTGRKTLQVMVLDMLHKGQSADGRATKSTSYYAYWFVGKGRETPYHVQRMIWMATDRIFHNVSHRWAYIAVAGTRDETSDAYIKQMQAFVHDLYPQIVLN